MFESIGANIENFDIVKGSEFQLNKNFFYDVLRMSTYTTKKEPLQKLLN